MTYVTWENVGVDRIGSAWLIRRFVDPKARFVFIPRGAPLPRGAEPFDLPGARLSHHRGHCTFHTIVRLHGMKDPALHRMARIVDEADTIQDVSLEPAAAGLDAICRGIRMTSRNDREALARGGIVYEALFALLKSEGGRE
ncbi:MAG: chromate resistance protein [Planctomycetes bacterium]|nr:chromate resistance protein [Planctomycetota bacterium]